MAKLIDITGKAISGEWGTDDITGEGTPVLRTTNFTNHGEVDYSDVVTRNFGKKDLFVKYLRQGDIIIEKSGGSDNQPVGRVIYFDGPDHTYLFNNFTGLLRVKDQEHWFPRYVFYALFSNYRRGGTKPFENRTTGLHNLQTESYVLRTTIQEAEYEKQQEICDTLDKLKKVIILRQNQLRSFNTLIKARFVEMFGDPVINPKGYPIVPISELFDVGSSKRVFESEWRSEGVPFYRAREIVKLSKDGIVDNELFIDEELYEKYKAKYGVPKAGDMMVTGVGTLGVCYIVQPTDRFYFKDGNTLWFKNKRLCNVRFIMEQYETDFVRGQIEANANISTVGTYTITNANNTMVLLPSKEEQDAFDSFVKQIDKSKSVIQQALTKDQLLFDSLMQKYFG